MLVVDVDEDSAVVQIPLLVSVSIEANFTFYVRDSEGDKLPMGSGTQNLHKELELEVLVTFSGEIGGEVSDLEIGDVELISKRVHVDFGEVGPDYSDE